MRVLFSTQSVAPGGSLRGGCDDRVVLGGLHHRVRRVRVARGLSGGGVVGQEGVVKINRRRSRARARLHGQRRRRGWDRLDFELSNDEARFWLSAQRRSDRQRQRRLRGLDHEEEKP